MKANFEDIQRALIEERITPKEFVSILLDNYGWAKTAEILKENLGLLKE